MKTLTSLTVLSAACFCLATSGLSAWERSALEKCKQDMSNCQSDVDRCKKTAKNSNDCKKMMEKCNATMDMCKRDADKTDESSFANALSPGNKAQFTGLSADQKKKAMDMADGNKMDPDDALAKTLGKGKSKY